MRTLEHINAATAQTWNYMKINEIALEVLEPSELLSHAGVAVECDERVECVECGSPISLKTLDKVPNDFCNIETGIGADAASWIDSASTKVAIDVPSGCSQAKPIVIDMLKAQTSSVCICVGENASAKIVVIADASAKEATCDSSSDSSLKGSPKECVVKQTTASLVRLIAKQNAHVDIFEIVALPDTKTHIEGFGIECEDGASIDVRQYALSAKTTAIGLAANLQGAESSIDLQLHYLGRNNQIIDVNHLVRMKGQKTRSRIDESGVLADSSHKTLRATIDLLRGGKGAKGREQETVVVTGDAVVNKTLPVILCDEEDVQGDHGATIGSMSTDQLEYMRDRGLNTKQAEELFERAVVDEAVIHAPTKRAHEVALSAAEMLFGKDAVEQIVDAVEHNWN